MAPPRKTKLNRKSTMAATAEIGKEIVGGEDLGETRQETKDIQKSKRVTQPKRTKTMQDVIDEGAQIINTPAKVSKPAAKEDSPKSSPKKGRSAKVKKGSMKAKKRASPKKGKAKGSAKKGSKAAK